MHRLNAFSLALTHAAASMASAQPVGKITILEPNSETLWVGTGARARL